MAEIAARKPLKVCENGALRDANPTAPDALRKSIKSLGHELLHKELEFLCCEFPAIIHSQEDRLLVLGKHIMRSHVDTDSEDDTNSEIQSKESGSGNDVDSHSVYEAYEDEPHCAEGFTWECCDKPGNGEECKSTRHKAKMKSSSSCIASCSVTGQEKERRRDAKNKCQK